MRTEKEKVGSVLVFAGGIIWGTIGPFIKLMESAGSTPAYTSFLRMFFAFFITALLTIFRYGIKEFRIDRKTLFVCAMLGLICHGIYNVFYSMSVNMAGVSVSAILLNIAPVFTAILSSVFYKEKITALKAIVLLVNIIGCFLAATGGKIVTASSSAIGILFGIGAGFCYALTAIIGKAAGRKKNPFVISTYSYLFAAIFLLIFAKPWTISHAYNGKLLIFGFFFALIPTVIAYLLYYKGLQIIKESSKVPVLASGETIVAVILGLIFYNESINQLNIMGMIIIMISIVLMNRTRENSRNFPSEKTYN